MRIVVAEAVVELTSAEDLRLEDSTFVTLAVVDVVSKDVVVTSATVVVELMVVAGTVVVLVSVGVVVVTHPPEIIPPEMPPEIPPEIPPDTPPEIQPEPDKILAEPSFLLYLISCRSTDFGKR